MNYVLFNHLSNNGEGEARADALLTSLGASEGDEYKKINLVGLDALEFFKGLTAEELSTESRIIAVADICDALLAADRPYKKPLPREQAFGIMRNMAKEGNIDCKLVEYLYECTEPSGQEETGI